MVCHDAWIELEEVEMRDGGVWQVGTEAADVNLSRSVEIKIAGQLVIQRVSNDNASSVFKFYFEIFDCDFWGIRMQVNRVDKIIDFILSL